MNFPKCPYQYIVVEGVIGVGKTSLCKLLTERLGGRNILEDFESNPFIEDFYRSPRENAFKAQLYFLIYRFKKQMEIPPPDLFDSPLLVDYLFQKDRIFAVVNLNDDELELYNTIWEVLAPKVRNPDLVVYLQASTGKLLERIKKRNRSYEKNISFEYLEALNNAYNEMYFHYSAAPVFIVNTDDIDFIDSPDHLDDLAAKIVGPHSGINFYHPGGM
ncbi:MAG: deoxynucleoside kinase [Candidatus Latescibacteria bacterium]|jgi:deoxyguanosine kinase|nr:deoxynucleoside kinase [Candidatus Latescibacterota bacterium]